MIQYILNMTAIWLISLLAFDLLLRRESYHTYNRLYLLSTFVMGLLIPLWQWQDDSLMNVLHAARPTEQVIEARQRIVTAAAASAPLSIEQWLLLAYLCGVAVALCIVAADVVKLVSLAATGKRHKEGSWTIIETGRKHAPFSLRHMLFVNSRQQYGTREWSIILSHEQRHTTLLHFADLVLMQLARIVLWFHPLVYAYYRRLLMVHEYQADDAAKSESSLYSRFLVDQALLQSAPVITHSFNRSPIKKRIIMLTRTSTQIAKIKTLVLAPLALVSIVCFSQNSFSQKFERNGKYVTYKGNKFEMSDLQVDTLIITDPVTGEEKTKIIQRDPMPEKMNGRPVITNADKDPEFSNNGQSFRDYMIKGLKKELADLKDGYYRLELRNLLIDEKGKVVYFDYTNMRRNKPMAEVPDAKSPTSSTTADAPATTVTINGQGAPKGTFTLMNNNDPRYFEELTKTQQQVIFNKVCKLTDEAPRFSSAVKNGKNVLAIYFSATIYNVIKIQDHKVYEQSGSQFVEL